MHRHNPADRRLGEIADEVIGLETKSFRDAGCDHRGHNAGSNRFPAEACLYAGNLVASIGGQAAADCGQCNSPPVSGPYSFRHWPKHLAHTLDPEVFIRSMATRGSLGGLSRATAEAQKLLDAFGFDWILVETVGVGQTELDVVQLADTTVVVLVPESG
ncbi:MAG: hypothetical protein HC938_17965, partial [Nitrospira sp.]|nr:hypothetical protein [Nitrospira sp.]